MGDNSENDAKTHTIEIQVLKRDYASFLSDFKEYKRERERDDEKRDTRDEKRDAAIRTLQDTIKWGLGALFVAGIILATIGPAIIKMVAKAMAE